MSDQELEQVTFSIILSSEWWKNPPKVRVYLDNELIESTVVKEKREDSEKLNISFERNLLEGEHTLGIELYGKEWAETQQNEEDFNKPLKDQLLIIEDVEIDEISLGYLVFSNSKFYPDRRMHTQLPEEMTELTSIGFNGKLELKFQVPTYIWFLENL